MAHSAAAGSGDTGTYIFGAAAHSNELESGVLTLDDQELPLVDAAVLQDLEDELGQPEMAWSFANDYAVMWRLRERCLLDSLEREDHSAALDAVISLKVSSAMVGGLRLARLAGALEITLRKGDLRAGLSFLAFISVLGQATVKELQSRYVQAGG
ncbi:hypothetical protein QFZ40_004352 [Arthrobacter pascens]|uniref:Hpt domain-containing protein n=1 Tax=Arthrobacter pascens TaxID=1677 RepID=UPI00278AFF5A|nr:Hpt domain-containing protein [Arthrobacter pascens]MDQ0636381.1 hypothetical protein [Arthrobacter pascens]